MKRWMYVLAKKTPKSGTTTPICIEKKGEKHKRRKSSTRTRKESGGEWEERWGGGSGRPRCRFDVRASMLNRWWENGWTAECRRPSTGSSSMVDSPLKPTKMDAVAKIMGLFLKKKPILFCWNCLFWVFSFIFWTKNCVCWRLIILKVLKEHTQV